jgi:hypothetical protein
MTEENASHISPDEDDASDLQKRRRDKSAEVQRALERRNTIARRIAKLEGEANARAQELQHEISVSQLNGDRQAMDDAQEALAKSNADLARQLPVLRAQLDEIDLILPELRKEEERLDAAIQAIDRREAEGATQLQEERARRLEEQLTELAPLVEAQREATGTSGIADLSADYSAQADAHSRAWRVWGATLIVTLGVAAIGSLRLLSNDHVPEGEITGETVVSIARNLLVVGLLLYAVRLASLQFRVHRHLEAVARNKSAALATFNRIVAVASEREVRNAIATVLAQSVFASEETGFVDSGNDHVTLIERVGAGLLPARTK